MMALASIPVAGRAEAEAARRERRKVDECMVVIF
jgi:hypothetical protein